MTLEKKRNWSRTEINIQLRVYVWLLGVIYYVLRFEIAALNESMIMIIICSENRA